MEYSLKLVGHFDKSQIWKPYLSKLSVVQSFYDVTLLKKPSPASFYMHVRSIIIPTPRRTLSTYITKDFF